MIFELVRDFSDALVAMPANHPKHRILRLLEEAIRRDVHFIDRHPTTLFQCMWNTCWWYDCPEATRHYEEPDGGRRADAQTCSWSAGRLSAMLELWRKAKDTATPRFCWVRSLRPMPLPLDAKVLRIFRGYQSSVESIDISPDGRRLLTCHYSPDKVVTIWDIDSGQVLLAFRPYKSRVDRARFSPDGRSVAVASKWDPMVVVCDASSAAVLFSLYGSDPVESPDPVRKKVAGVGAVTFSPDNRKLAAGANDSIVRVWDLDSEHFCRRLRGHENSVTNVAFSPDGRLIASASQDKTVRLWDVVSGQQMWCARGHEEWVTGLAFSPDGRHVASGSHDKTIRLWNVQTGEETRTLVGHLDPVVSVAFSPDGRRMASGDIGGSIRVWDLLKGALLGCLAGHEHIVSEVRYLPDGQRLMSGSWDQTVRIWDAAELPPPRHLCGSRRELLSVSASAANDCFATGSREGMLDIWDGQTGVLLRTIEAHEQSATNVAFSPDGMRLLSGSRDATICVWDWRTGQKTLNLGEHKLWPVWLTFSSDGRRIVCLFYDDEVRTWDAETGGHLSIGHGSSAFLREAGITCYIRERKGLWDVETVFDETRTGRPMAWFPEPLITFVHSPVHPRWAGLRSMGRHLFLLGLEGSLTVQLPDGEVIECEVEIRSKSYPEATSGSSNQ